MKFLRIRRRRTAWLSLWLVLWQTLLPFSTAMAAQWRGESLPVCTASGLQWISVDEEVPAPAPGTDQRAHCVWCLSTADDGFGVPSDPSPTVLLEAVDCAPDSPSIAAALPSRVLAPPSRAPPLLF